MKIHEIIFYILRIRCSRKNV